MKRAPSINLSSQRGSALLTALCLTAILGIALGSYVAVCYQTLNTSSRTSAATSSLELAETGLEEALSALNQSTYSWSDWALDNSINPKTATKTLTGFPLGNGASGAVSITIANYDGRTSGIDPALIATGTVTLADGTVITRKLESTAKLSPLFVNAVAATYRKGTSSDSSSSGGSRGVYFGNGGTIESFDSNPVIPLGEDEAARNLRETLAGYSAIVSSNNRLTLVDTSVRGFIATATDVSTSDGAVPLLLFTTNSGTRVAGPATSASVKIDQARVSSSPYQPVFEVKVPSTVSAEVVPAGTTVIGNVDPDAPEKVYRADELKLTSGETLSIQGKVLIVVSGDFWIESTSQIEILPHASLQIVVTDNPSGPSTVKIGGNGILNRTGLAKNLAIFYTGNPGLASGNEPTLSTATDFCGVIYAPNCGRDFKVTSNLKFTGSLVAKSVNVSGTPEIRYDLDLRRPSTKFLILDTPFAVSFWREITP